MHSPEFIATHRARPQDFTRSRTLTFPILVACLAQGMTRSLQVELDDFFGRLADTARFVRQTTKSAFSQARKKLRASVFADLNACLLAHWRDQVEEPVWHGFRLVAADATTLRLPNTPDIVEDFGVINDRWGGSAPLTQVLALQAVQSGLILHAEMHPAKARERAMLAGCLDALEHNDLLLLDRGFPAYWLFAWLRQHDRHFCCRIDSEAHGWLNDFLGSRESERVIEATVSPQALRRAEAAGFMITAPSFRFRAIRVPLPSGQVEVLATSLVDTEAYPAEAFAALYHQRWRIEECFKRLKCRLAVEHFSGESVEAVRQDFLAKIWLENVTASLAYLARDTLPVSKRDDFKPNLVYAVSALSAKLPLWLLRGVTTRGIGTLVRLIAATLEWIRTDRTYPRSRQVVNPIRFRAYKPVR